VRPWLKRTSGYGAPADASGTSAPPAPAAAGYQTTVGSVRSGAPGKAPFAGVGRVGSTSTTSVSPTSKGPGSAKRDVARASRTRVVTGAPSPRRRVQPVSTNTVSPTDTEPSGARGQVSSAGSSSAAPAMCAVHDHSPPARSGLQTKRTS